MEETTLTRGDAVAPAPDPEPAPLARPGDPATLVIFGGLGDLARRKLFPSLMNLQRNGLLPDGFAVIGVGRQTLDHASYREEVSASLMRSTTGPIPADAWSEFAARLHFVQGELRDAVTYARLAEEIDASSNRFRTDGNVLFYLATPPSAFSPIVRRLGEAGLARGDAGWRRVVVEKPFGAALRLDVDNWRWAGVPFYVRTGKRLPLRRTEMVVEFRRPPLTLFQAAGVASMEPNRLHIHIQPEEAISLEVKAKERGAAIRVRNVRLAFDYGSFGGKCAATGYERLLYDALVGDMTLFHRADMVDAAWRIATPVLDVWAALPARDFPNYVAGSWGPPARTSCCAATGGAGS